MRIQILFTSLETSFCYYCCLAVSFEKKEVFVKDYTGLSIKRDQTILTRQVLSIESVIGRNIYQNVLPLIFVVGVIFVSLYLSLCILFYFLVVQCVSST